MNILTFKIVSSRTSRPVSILSYVNANFVFTFLYSFYCKWHMLQFCLTSLLASFHVGWSFQMGSAYQFHSWRVFVLVCAFPSVAAISALTTMPESPRFYLEVSLTAHTPLRPCGNIFLNTFWMLECINSLKVKKICIVDKVLLMHFSKTFWITKYVHIYCPGAIWTLEMLKYTSKILNSVQYVLNTDTEKNWFLFKNAQYIKKIRHVVNILVLNHF